MYPHDQEEALTLADRVAVMNLGRVEQVGTTEEVFERPRTRFVADFMGAVNFLDGFVVRPEKMRLHATATAGGVEGRVESRVYQGETTRWQVRTADGRLLTAVEQNDGVSDAVSRLKPGDPVWVKWNKRHEVPMESGPRA